MKVVRSVIEPEVIAEFLANEFHHDEFRSDRHLFESLVREPNTSDGIQNAVRRALLFRRRATMWRELPEDISWWEVRLEPNDLNRLCVFSRTYWRSIGRGSVLLTNVVDKIRNHDFQGEYVLGGTARGSLGLTHVGAVIKKVRDLSQRLVHQDQRSAVILVGTSLDDQLTILEGNHRLTAALLNSTDMLLNHFRFLVGTSERMVHCCWYRSTLPNFVRYARNRIRTLWYDPEADVHRILHPIQAACDLPDPLTAPKPMVESK